MFPPDQKSYWLKKCSELTNEPMSKFTSGELFPVYVECIPFIIVATIVSCNCYRIDDIVELYLSLINLINILLDFNSFKGKSITDKVNLAKNFVNAMIKNDKTPHAAYQEALASVNKGDANMKLNNNNNNNNNNGNYNKKTKNNSYKQKKKQFNKFNNKSFNFKNDFIKQELIQSYILNNMQNNNNNFPNNNNVNNNNNNFHNSNNNKRKGKKDQNKDGHVCYGVACRVPGCAAGLNT